MNRIIAEDFSILFHQYEEVLKELRHSSIFITGSCGMIPSYLAMFLLHCSEKLELDIYLQCRNKQKGQIIFAEFSQNPRMHLVDVPLDRCLEDGVRYDYIIHGASPASTKQFQDDPVGVINPNVIGCWNLLQYASEHQTRNFVFLSSNAIYGEGGLEKTVLTEEDYGIVDPLGDRACYIEAKRMGEQLCTAFARQYGVHTNMVRICHTFGPTFDILNDTRILPKVIRQIINRQDITIYKDPSSVIQYTYAADIIMGILCVMMRGESGAAYNACGDEVMQMDRIISSLVNADTRIQSNLVEIPIDEKYAFSSGRGINFLKLSNQKLKMLGWNPLFPVEEGLKRMMESYLDQV